MKKSLPKMRIVFNVQKEVNPAFRVVWNSNKPYNILKGGRNSFKSSVIAMKLVRDMVKMIDRGETANIVIIRKVGNTLRTSVFNKIKWALRKYGIFNQFTTKVSPFEIRHKETGSAFFFYGQDDFEKLKSNELGNVIAVWYEEAAEFGSAEEFDQSNSTFMRQKHADIPFVQFFWSYNPPRNPYVWINEWADLMKLEPDYLVHESSYQDDVLGFVTEQMLLDIDRIRRNDYDYYRYLYLGHSVGLGTNVYNIDLFKPLEEVPKGERIVYLYFAADSGHQQSATTCLALGLTNKGNIIVLDTYYYSPKGLVVKKAPTDLSKDLHEFQTDVTKRFNYQILRNRTIDSAEGALRNEYYKMYALRWSPVPKKTKVIMTGHVQSLLAQGRVHYLKTDNNIKYFIEEHKRYLWDEKTIKDDVPKVVKDDDHTCDAFQYFVMDNAADLDLVA